MHKKIKLSIIMFLCLAMLSSCGKKDSEEGVDINLPIDSSSNVEESTTNESTSNENESTNKEDSSSSEEDSESKTPTISKEDVSNSSTYKTQQEERNKLRTFYEQLKLLLEDDLLANYKSTNLGTNIENVVENLDTLNLRYINNVTLSYLYDENGNLINMGDRKGLIVFSSSNLSLEEETGRTCNKDNYTRANAGSVKIDVAGCDFDSFVAYTFNDEGVLIGKFKYLLTEERGKKVDVDKLSGSLNFSDAISLKIDEDASNKDVYERIDLVKALIEEYDTSLVLLQKASFERFKKVYESLSDETISNDLIDMIQDNDLNIEKMPTSAITKFNQKYLNNYKNGYYISMSLEEEYTSPDMRYDNSYLIVIFNDSDHIWYKQIISPTYNDIVCENELNADDFSLVQIYSEIASYQKKIDALKSDKDSFYEYLKSNLDLLNVRVSFDMTKSDILGEIEDSQLTFEDDYQNLVITNVKNKDNETILLKDAYGNVLYDSCVKVTDTNRSIFYFFTDDESLFGIYRSEYMDSVSVSLKNYYNLGTINKGMKQVLDKEEEYNLQRQMYINMANKKLADFMSNISYKDISTGNQIYRKSDILKALSLNGFKYEEGMNKVDGLYYIGIFALDTDTKYAYKIYFNVYEEVELVQ